MSLYVNNNGVLIPSNAYAIKAGNRGHLYGDGLFESIRVINGRAVNMENHMKRLKDGMRAIKMNVPKSFTVEFFEKEINGLIEQNNISAGGKVRLSIDRKPGGTFMPKDNDVDFFIEANPISENKYVLNEVGWKVNEYQEMKKDITPLSIYKTKNSLIYIMAKIKAKELGMDDMLILNYRSGIIEAASSNLFVVSNGVLYTPGLDLGCLAGTMRMQIINLAIANNMKVYECNISPQNLLVADEVFLTNAIKGVIWVENYRTKQYFNYISKELTTMLNEHYKAK